MLGLNQAVPVVFGINPLVDELAPQ